MRTREPVAAAVLTVAAVALLAAACGGSPRSNAAQAGPVGPAIAFARCMRSNGVAHYPDPGSGGALVKETPEELGVSGPLFASAERACSRLLPNGGSPPDQAQLEHAKAEGLTFARCVRRHGVPNFPDPASDGRIPDPATVGINQGAPAFEAANQACRTSRPPYMPSNAAYNAWARTHAGGLR